MQGDNPGMTLQQPARHAPRTFGIEEEVILLEPGTLAPVDVADEVIAELEQSDGGVHWITHEFLRAQVEEGASAAQLFDSWAGSLPLEQYREHVAPASRTALDAVRHLTDANGRRVPLVHFGVGAGELYGAMDLDVDCVGVDWRVPLDIALERIDSDVTVQGNLDPAVLGAPWEIVEAAIDHVMMAGSVARAHVFNLGHGVPPSTDPTVLTRIVEAVHAR